MQSCEQNLVSIITPAFNRLNSLKIAARSILNQHYENWEWIIVDDGSEDGTEEFASELCNRDARVIYLKREKGPKGANTCRNIGIDSARGYYILFLDSDDLLLTECILNRVESFEKRKELDFMVFQGAVFFEKDDSKLYNWNVEKQSSDLERFLCFDGPWQTTGPLWKKDSIRQFGLKWDTELMLWQDVDFHCSALMLNMKYQVNWHSPVDYLVKADSHDSMSRVDYHSPQKSASRIYFWNKMLNNSSDNRSFNTGWLRPLLGFVLNSLTLSKNLRGCKNALSKALAFGVIHRTERIPILLACFTAIITHRRILSSFLKWQKLLYIPSETLQKQPFEHPIDISSNTRL